MEELNITILDGKIIDIFESSKFKFFIYKVCSPMLDCPHIGV